MTLQTFSLKRNTWLKAAMSSLIMILAVSSFSQRITVNDQLFMAIDDQDTAAIMKAIAAGANINKRVHGETALCHAVLTNNAQVLDVLGRVRARINKRSEGSTALQLALENCMDISALWLINAGADLSVKTRHDKASVMHLSTNCSSTIVTDLLIKKGAAIDEKDKYGWTPVMKALFEVNDEASTLLLKHGANGDFLIEGIPSLAFALESQCPDELSAALIRQGAETHFEEELWGDPLEYALERKLYETAGLLARNGFDPDLRIYGEPVLSYLLNSKYDEENVDSLLCIFLENGVNPDVSIGEELLIQHVFKRFDLSKRLKATLLDKMPASAMPINILNSLLHSAVSDGYPDMVADLIKRGADCNSLDLYGIRLLNKAIWSGNITSIEHLLNSGADINARDELGQTALHHIVTFIGEFGLDIEAGEFSAEEMNKKTPYFSNMSWKDLNLYPDKAVELLYKHGADFSIKDNEGASPLELSRQMQNNHAIQLFMKYSTLQSK